MPVLSQRDYSDIHQWIDENAQYIKAGKTAFGWFCHVSYTQACEIKQSTGRARDAFTGELIPKGRTVVEFSWSPDGNPWTGRSVKVDITDMLKEATL